MFSRYWMIVISLLALVSSTAKAACVYTLSPTNRVHGSGVSTGFVSVATDPTCTWIVTNNNPWITITPPTNGVGSNFVRYTLATNANALQRTGNVFIAGQKYTVIQEAASCSYKVIPGSRTHGYGATNATLTVTAGASCFWNVYNTNTWITILSNASGTGSNVIGYAISDNLLPFWRTGLVLVVDQVFALAQKPAPCNYSLTPGSLSFPAAPSTGTVSVASTTGCSWTATNNNSWITILSGGSGNGNGNITFSVASNQVGSARSGFVYVGDQVFTVNQAGSACSYSLSSGAASYDAFATNGSVNVSSLTGCAWTVTNTLSWITLISSNGSGNGTVSYNVAANNSGPRTGILTIAGQPYTISQSGTCGYKLSPINRTHGYSPASNFVSLTASNTCAWSVVVTNPWITISSNASGTGSANIGYVVATNATPFDRLGAISVADQSLVLLQHGYPCNFSLSPTNDSYPGAATSGVVVVTATVGCPWSAVNTNTWITIIAGQNGTGTGSVSYTVDPNLTSVSRTGLVVIAGQSYTVVQSGACNYKISPTTRMHGYSGSSNFVALTTSNSCTWSVLNTNGWITIVPPTSGTGAANIGYTVDPNPTGNERTGSVFIADQVMTIIQHGAGCNYDLSPTNRTHGSAAASNYVTLTTSNFCVWSVVNTNPWITIATGTSGAGTAQIGYLVAANSGADERTGVVMVADQSLTLVQHGQGCVYAWSPSSRTHGYGATTGIVSVVTSAGCAWNVTITNNWITVLSGSSGTGNGDVTYTVDLNTSFSDRIGALRVDGQYFTITQRAFACSYSLSPTNRNHGYTGSTGTINVATSAGCNWTVGNTNDWVTIQSGGSGTGNGLITYSVDPNFSVDGRTGYLAVADQVFLVTEAGFPCSYKTSPASRNHGFGAATNIISVTAATNCVWAVNCTNDWVTIRSAAIGSGNGLVTYSVSANLTPTSRTGVVMVADQSMVINQRGVTNGFAFDFINLLPGGLVDMRLSGGPGGLWEILSSVDLLTWNYVTSATNITGTVEVIVPGPTNKQAVFYRAVQPCTLQISTNSGMQEFAPATNTVSVVASTNCTWTAGSTNDWISIRSGISGSGNGTVKYAVSANLSATARTGVVVIGDQVLTLTQKGLTNGFVFNSITMQNGQIVSMRLSGGPGGVWRLQGSEDIKNWQTVASITNLTGVVDYSGPVATNKPYRFYRAVQP